MKVNFKKPFIGIDGKPVTILRNKCEVVAMISKEVETTLFSLANLHGTPLSGEQKYRAYNLCRALSEATGEIEISIEDAGFIKEVCSEYLSAGAYGQVVDIIEGKY